MRYQNILLAVDGSDHALRATAHAIKFVKNVREYNLDVVIVIKTHLNENNSFNMATTVEEKLKLTKRKLKKAGVHFRTV
ncbi:universal stress protein [Gracilibacillus kekensis]|uniref:universal stress protein n=1 Tax=Gracilibacillus kekensis TaxID=1027249 RepID=UPI00093405CE|nr:universal stress protein [Gracilibacillus kekensis]